ncbi:MAG: EamA family transporter [Pseudomonadota bacterium]
MGNTSLYALSVLIWGSTWLAINYQLGVVPLEVSVFYRYAAAAGLMMVFCVATRRPLRYGRAEHLMFAGMGLSMFSLNYLMAYGAQLYVSSAINALIFSSVVWLNILNARLFLGVRADSRIYGASVLGVAGLVVLFWPSLRETEGSGALLIGGGMSLIGSLSASLGNVLSQHAQSRHALPVIQANAWSMSYGAVFNLIIALALGREFLFDPRPAYVLSLIYLVIPGTIIAFGAYLTLVGRIGAHRAGYSVVMFPVVAVVLAVLFEGLPITPWLLAGMALVLGGNALVLLRPKKVRPPAGAFSGNENSA